MARRGEAARRGVSPASASQLALGSTTLPRNHERTFGNTVLNEDQGAILNPDEIRAIVTLAPRSPISTGPRPSNLVALAL